MALRIRKQRDGSFSLKMGDNERGVVRSLLPQIRDLVDQRDSLAWRLFPNAYQDDPDAAAQYEDMVGDELRAKRIASIDTIERTIDASSLSEEELLAWMGAVNDLRLVIGTRLDVTEETEIDDYIRDAERGLFATYSYLGYLLESIVTALHRSN